MIQSVSRALDILTVVSDTRGEPVTLGTIAEKTGINPSTCAHLVDTLCQKGFLSRISRSSGYILGAYAYYLTRYKTFQKELVSTCNPALRWIQRHTGHTALLAVMVEGEKFVISYAEDSKDVLRDRGELYRGNLYSTATGRAMLAGMRRSELVELVDKIGLPSEEDWPGVNSLQALERNLQRISGEKLVCIERRQGELYDAIYGVRVNAPRVRNCAVGLHVRQDTPLTPQQQKQYREVLTAGVREINRRLRFEHDLA